MSLTVHSKIDEGSFGEIYLGIKNGGSDNNKMYAIKTIQMDEDNSIQEQYLLCFNELRMFKLVHRVPFFLQLIYACKIENEYHFVTDFMPAGDLFDYFMSQLLELDEVKICSAEIMLALGYLHKQNIVYRDLKLENILIVENGHILLTDFGLARRIRRGTGKLHDEAGTLTYFAPGMTKTTWAIICMLIKYLLYCLLEMVVDDGHSFEVDWWAFGIIIFELLVGHSPFLVSRRENPTAEDLRNRILNDHPCLYKLKNVAQNTSAVTNLVQELLQKNPKKRLGVGQNGVEDIKQHPFYSSLNWTAVKLKRYPCLKHKSTKEIQIGRASHEIILSEDEAANNKLSFISPELQQQHDETPFHGMNGAEPLPANRIDVEINMIHQIHLKDGLYIQTTSMAKTIKKLITPRKNVLENNSRKTKRSCPYRRSNRVSDRRSSLI